MANINIKPSKTMPNLLHTLDPYANEEENVINCLVEINSHTINKYEYIVESGHIKLDRVGYSTLSYPLGYGLMPKTWDLDNDMLDVVIAGVTEPLFPGCLVEARVIGVMKFDDSGEQDDKIIVVLNDDKRMDHIKTYEDLGDHAIKEITYYFEHYKDLKKPGVCKVQGFHGIETAKEVIAESIERYNKEYAPKLD